jgi:hypothetical protein
MKKIQCTRKILTAAAVEQHAAAAGVIGQEQRSAPSEKHAPRSDWTLKRHYNEGIIAQLNNSTHPMAEEGGQQEQQPRKAEMWLHFHGGHPIATRAMMALIHSEWDQET